jgi:hypothetical protein
VPTIGGDGDGSLDQRRVESFPDVLLVTTAPLAEPLEVIGSSASSAAFL